MEFLFFEEFIRLLLCRCDKNPELFVTFFDDSDFLFGYCYYENKFTHVSNSFQKILGYHNGNILYNKNFSSNIIHPFDRKNLKEHLNFLSISSFEKSNSTSDYNLKRTKCRAKHIKGYWKYFIVFSIDCWCSNTDTMKKLGLFANEHVKQIRKRPFKDMDSFQLNDCTSEKNTQSQEMHDSESVITPRESEILKFISDGMIAKEIANELNISISTVITHRKNLISKFKAHNTAELIKRATKLMMV